MKKRKLIIVLAISMILSSCSKKVKLESFKNTFYGTFDTVITYLAFEENEKNFEKNYEFVEKEYQRLHKLYDRYNSYEGVVNVKTINENAGIKPVKVEKDLFDIIKFSIDNYEKTKGKVNIAMGSVLEIWHKYRLQNEGLKENETRIPKKEELLEANKNVDINNIVLDEKNMEVYIKDPKLSIDLGSVAKGYATELIAKKLVERGVKHAIINAGGNVRVIGKPGDDRKTWKIALQNPDLNSSDPLDILSINDKSVVTSGDYQRYFIHKGRNYHHIIDPITLEPGGEFSSISIVVKDSGIADLLSTAVYLSSKEEALEIIKNYEDVGVVWYSMNSGKDNTENLDEYLESKNSKIK